MVTGVMSALAGCFLSIGDIHTFTEGMTKGVGYLAIAAVIFGNWKLGRTLAACLLFGRPPRCSSSCRPSGWMCPAPC
jgi:simple sugar transport system permease protein